MRVHVTDQAEVVHLVHTDMVDQFDEISGESQLVLLWCETHETYEWHWIERHLL